MNALESNGQKSYVIYTITTFEQSIETESVDYYVYKDFDIKRKHRPIFTFSNTTGSIQVELKIVSYVDGSSIIKINEVSLEPAILAKYGNNLMSINVSGVVQQNIFNAKPNQLVISPVVLNAMSRRNSTQYNTVIRTVTVPVIANNIVIKDINNQNVFNTQDNLELIIHPFDNYIKFAIATSGKDSYEPMTFNSNIILSLNFSGNGVNVSVSTDASNTENKPGSGVLVFNIKSVDAINLSKIFNDNNRFYLTQKDENNNEVVLYSGLFIMSNSQEYLNRISKTSQPQVTPVASVADVTTPINTPVTTTPAVIPITKSANDKNANNLIL